MHYRDLNQVDQFVIWFIRFPVNFSILFRSGITSVLNCMHWNCGKKFNKNLMTKNQNTTNSPSHCWWLSAPDSVSCEHTSCCNDNWPDPPSTSPQQRSQSPRMSSQTPFLWISLAMLWSNPSIIATGRKFVETGSISRFRPVQSDFFAQFATFTSLVNKACSHSPQFHKPRAEIVQKIFSYAQ